MFDQEDDKKHCPQCRTIMLLERVAPKFGPLPELRTYKCQKCGHVIKYEIEPQTGWAQYAFDLKPRA
jgi:DNA-directed RNA polymerase subunit RPC12/RpoP